MNNYLDRIPTYTEKSTSYYTLLTSLHNYIVNTGILPLQTFMVSMQTVPYMIADSTIYISGDTSYRAGVQKYTNISKMLLNRLDGALRYYPQIAGQLSQDDVVYLYLNAITSVISLRNNVADKVSLKEQFDKLFPESTIVITDGGLSAREHAEKLMTINIDITLNTPANIYNIFALYYLPNINGVQINVQIKSSDTLIMTPLREGTTEYSSTTNTAQGYVVKYTAQGNTISFTATPETVSAILEYLKQPDNTYKTSAMASKRIRIGQTAQGEQSIEEVIKTTPSGEQTPDITDSGRSLQGK